MKTFRIGPWRMIVRPYAIDRFEIRLLDERPRFPPEQLTPQTGWSDIAVVEKETWEVIEALLQFRDKMHEVLRQLMSSKDWPSSEDRVEPFKAQRDALAMKLQTAIAAIMKAHNEVS